MSTSASTLAAGALYKHWTEDHESLGGPHDFHSLQHYLDLYVLAKKNDNEELQNKVMDLTRTYYRTEKMTAPAFRLDYIYSATQEPNAMRVFLLQTAAFRALCEQPDDSGRLISDSIRGVLAKNSDMAIEFAEALIELSKNDLADPRHGPDCAWHAHDKTAKCDPVPAEAWQGDGTLDKPNWNDYPEKPTLKVDAPVARGIPQPKGPLPSAAPSLPTAPSPRQSHLKK